MDGRGAVRNSDQYVIDGDQLMIEDVCAISDGDGMSYQCGGVLPTGTTVMGGDYHVKPLGELVLCTPHIGWTHTHTNTHTHTRTSTHTHTTKNISLIFMLL